MDRQRNLLDRDLFAPLAKPAIAATSTPQAGTLTEQGCLFYFDSTGAYDEKPKCVTKRRGKGKR